MERQVWSTKLILKKYIARDLLELKFQKPTHFKFKAGQFVQFLISHDDQHVLRSYSISSIFEDEYLEFCVKLLPEGKGSAFFSGIEINENASFCGPEGRFVCEENHFKKKYFIATGAGLAPIMSMIKNELTNKKNERVELLCGVRNEEDLFWIDRLEEFKNKYSFFNYKITLSKPSENWLGLKGRVTEYVPLVKEVDQEYYICGSLEMVKDVRAKLTTHGMLMKQIHFEIF